jgi:hypothetical protein
MRGQAYVCRSVGPAVQLRTMSRSGEGLQLLRPPIYCARGCANETRRWSMREAGRRYQQTTRGRLNHAARQRRYRQKRLMAPRVTTVPAQSAAPAYAMAHAIPSRDHGQCLRRSYIDPRFPELTLNYMKGRGMLGESSQFAIAGARIRGRGGWPPSTTTRCSVRPAPTIATCGGTTTRPAKWPAIMPKFDSVIVAPRSSSGGIERAAASARMRLSQRASCWRVRRRCAKPEPAALLQDRRRCCIRVPTTLTDSRCRVPVFGTQSDARSATARLGGGQIPQAGADASFPPHRPRRSRTTSPR